MSPGELYALIKQCRTITRAEIRHATGLSRTAVTARVEALLTHGLIFERQQPISTAGRPAAVLSCNADAGVVLSAAIGRSRTRLAVCNLAADVLTSADIEQSPGLRPDDLMPDIVKRLDRLIEEADRRQFTIYGIGLNLPGPIDQDRGCSLSYPVMTGWDRVPLRPYFAELSPAPVYLDNDANVIAAAECHRDRGKLVDLLVVKASTGLGVGIVSRGAVHRGATQAAGELGHTKTHSAEGLPCRCGDTGCLESIAGGWALVRALQDSGEEVNHLRDVVELANGGHADARRMIRDSGRHIGEALAAAVNLLNPSALIVAGDMGGAYDVFAAGLREALYGNATALATRRLQVEPCTHGDLSGVIGGAVMVLDQVLDPAVIDASIAS